MKKLLVLFTLLISAAVAVYLLYAYKRAPWQRVPEDMAVIPAGSFEMGCDQESNPECRADEMPKHRVELSRFLIDKYEVTNAHYCAFHNSLPQGEVSPQKWFDFDQDGALIRKEADRYTPEKQYEDHPVVNVTYYGAEAYCAWVGKRLPTEAEWEKAACGGGDHGEAYPWGNEASCDKANYSACRGGAAPVGTYAPNAYGIHDTAGNVWEWVSDWYDGGYYAASPGKNPLGPAEGTTRMIRGGSWNAGASRIRCTARNQLTPAFVSDNVGFRCAK